MPNLLAAFALLIGAPAAGAAAQEDSEPLRFEIRRFLLEGNTLLPTHRVEQLLTQYRGREKDFGDIQRALEALTEAYREIGYGIVQVTLPEQNITQGEIRFVVIEPRLGKVVVEGNKSFGEANVRRSVPALREGEAPNSRAMSRSLQIANENPSKQTQVTLRAGEAEDKVDAVVKVADEKLWKAGVTVDNTGTTATGRWRVGAS